MNIFVILIMGIMLATYQYFTSKRSSDTVLNKDELRLQAELNCMKQYHNFASTRNEYIKGGENINIGENSISLKTSGDADKDHVNYTCTGSDATGDEELYVTKYCLNGSKQAAVSCDSLKEHKADCNDSTTSNDETSPVGFHCVSTTKWKKFGNSSDDKNKYLSAYVIKNGVNIAKRNTNPDASEEENNTKPFLIKGFYANFKNIEHKENYTPIGLVSCVNACKVLRQTELEGTNCDDGSSPIEIDGHYVCAKSTNRSPCTAHEKEFENIEPATLNGMFAKESPAKYCTKDISSNKYCCAINFYAGNYYEENVKDCRGTDRPTDCCPRDTLPEWQGHPTSTEWEENTTTPYTRYWICRDKNDINHCKNDVYMKIVDEKGSIITGLNGASDGYISVADPGIIQYEQTPSGGKYKCTLNKTDFIKKCRALEDQNHSFLKVTGVDYTYDESTAENFETIKVKDNPIFSNPNKAPTCHLISKSNAKSAENYNPCQYAYFDKNANKWTCGNYTLNDLKTNINLISNDGTSGSLVTTTAKGVKACLSTCSIDQLKEIRAGRINGKYWGLNYNDKTHMWSCFTCNPYSYSNSVWGCTNKINPIENCTRDTRATQHDDNHIVMDISTTHTQIKPDILNAEKITTCTCNREGDWQTALYGKCVPFSCDDSFQVMINGICYTRWCRKEGDFPSHAEINTPDITKCPTSHPWVVFNSVKSCIYCVKPLQ